MGSNMNPMKSAVSSETTSEIKPRDTDYWRNWFAFCILGTLNNLGYVVVGSSAQSLCDDFDQSNLLGLITWANVGVGFFVRILNAYMENRPFRERILLNGFFMILGFAGLLISEYISFWFALGSILFVGASSSFGESATLGYLRKYPADLVSGWSCGTGWAGVGGSGLYLGLVAIGLSNQAIFGMMLPTVVIYWIAFFIVLRPPISSKDGNQYHQFKDSGEVDISVSQEAIPVATATTFLAPSSSSAISTSNTTFNTQTSPFLSSSPPSSSPPARPTSFLGMNPTMSTSSRAIDTTHSTFIPPLYPHNNNNNNNNNNNLNSNINNDSIQNDDDSTTTSSLLNDPTDVDSVTITIHSKVPGLSSNTKPETEWERFQRCGRIVAWLSLQLGLVYFFEYYIQTGGADKANSNPDDSNNWEYENSYALLAVCYQVGVLLSRSSLNFVKITIVEILTVLQGLNFIYWLIQDSYKLFNVWIQFVIMVYVGLLGGLSYVNTFYLLLNSNSIQKRDKEYCINLVALAINVGIIFAATFTLLAENTWLKDE